MPNRHVTLPPIVAALALGACAGVRGDFVWVDAYPVQHASADKGYVIAAGDQLSVRVYNQDALSGRARVRDDGKISLPFVNDVQAAGLTPAALSERLQARLKDFIVNPMVTVSLEEARPFDVYVVGEVAHPGRFAFAPGANVLQAIAAAGGLTPYANRDAIFVVRQETAPVRVRFRYEALIRVEGGSATFRLKSGDTVVVE